MSALRVSIGAPTTGGQLRPRYDSEADILAVTSETPRDCPYGVAIDGNVGFDLDPQRHLVSMDIHIGRRLWERSTVRRWPQTAAAGTIVFSKETIDRKSLSVPLRFVYDEEQHVLHVAIGNLQAVRELELSREYVALLSRSELVGFLVRC